MQNSTVGGTVATDRPISSDKIVRPAVYNLQGAPSLGVQKN
jgi:hypothetical protein